MKPTSTLREWRALSMRRVSRSNFLCSPDTNSSVAARRSRFALMSAMPLASFPSRALGPSLRPVASTRSSMGSRVAEEPFAFACAARRRRRRRRLMASIDSSASSSSLLFSVSAVSGADAGRARAKRAVAAEPFSTALTTSAPFLPSAAVWFSPCLGAASAESPRSRAVAFVPLPVPFSPAAMALSSSSAASSSSGPFMSSFFSASSVVSPRSVTRVRRTLSTRVFRAMRPFSTVVSAASTAFCAAASICRPLYPASSTSPLADPALGAGGSSCALPQEAPQLAGAPPHSPLARPVLCSMSQKRGCITHGAAASTASRTSTPSGCGSSAGSVSRVTWTLSMAQCPQHGAWSGFIWIKRKRVRGDMALGVLSKLTGMSTLLHLPENRDANLATVKRPAPLARFSHRSPSTLNCTSTPSSVGNGRQCAPGVMAVPFGPAAFSAATTAAASSSSPHFM